MAAEQHISRRALLKGAAPVAAGIILTAGAASAGSLPDGTLDGLIERHRRTYADYAAAVAEEDRLYALLPAPEVVLKRNYDTKEPIEFARSEAQVHRHFDGLPADFFPNKEKNRARKLEEFREWKARWEAARVRSGAGAAGTRASALSDEVNEAFEALCAYAPQNFAEVRKLSAYLVEFREATDPEYGEWIFIDLIESWAKAGALS